MPIGRWWPWLLIGAAGCAGPEAVGQEPPAQATRDGGVPLAAAATNVWTTKAAMPTAREGLAVGVVNGIVYAIGGSGSAGNLTKVEAYNPGSNTWTTRAPLPQGRGGLNGVG